MNVGRMTVAILGTVLIINGAASQSSSPETSHRIDYGQALPSQALQAAERMVAKGAGAFTIATGVGANEISRVSFGNIGPDAQYPIASASKFLTAATVMAVVDAGKLALDRPISTWLPEISGAARELTLRQLLSQTSGLAGSRGELFDLAQDHRITLAQSAEELTQRPLVSRPGEVFAYGGPGFQVAGAAVEAATGKRWAEVFAEKIGQPLRMTRTYWTHLRLDRSGELPVAQTLNPVLQGGAVSTAEDYMHFLSMIAQDGMYEGKRILSPTAIAALLSDQTAKARMTPTGASVLPNAHYSLGNWCETWDKQGRCDRNSSLGLFGVYPWVERKTQRFGIIFIYVRDDAFRLWPQMQAIRDSVGK